ncbi:MAG: hypothetical protein WCI27_06030, partial [Candidatus Omnitrophota bacterium]
ALLGWHPAFTALLLLTGFVFWGTWIVMAWKKLAMASGRLSYEKERLNQREEDRRMILFKQLGDLLKLKKPDSTITKVRLGEEISWKRDRGIMDLPARAKRIVAGLKDRLKSVLRAIVPGRKERQPSVKANELPGIGEETVIVPAVDPVKEKQGEVDNIVDQPEEKGGTEAPVVILAMKTIEAAEEAEEGVQDIIKEIKSQVKAVPSVEPIGKKAVAEAPVVIPVMKTIEGAEEVEEGVQDIIKEIKSQKKAIPSVEQPEEKVGTEAPVVMPAIKTIEAAEQDEEGVQDIIKEIQSQEKAVPSVEQPNEKGGAEVLVVVPRLVPSFQPVIVAWREIENKLPRIIEALKKTIAQIKDEQTETLIVIIPVTERYAGEKDIPAVRTPDVDNPLAEKDKGVIVSILITPIQPGSIATIETPVLNHPAANKEKGVVALLLVPVFQPVIVERREIENNFARIIEELKRAISQVKADQVAAPVVAVAVTERSVGKKDVAAVRALVADNLAAAKDKGDIVLTPVAPVQPVIIIRRELVLPVLLKDMIIPVLNAKGRVINVNQQGSSAAFTALNQVVWNNDISHGSMIKTTTVLNSTSWKMVVPGRADVIRHMKNAPRGGVISMDVTPTDELLRGAAVVDLPAKPVVTITTGPSQSMAIFGRADALRNPDVSRSAGTAVVRGGMSTSLLFVSARESILRARAHLLEILMPRLARALPEIDMTGCLAVSGEIFIQIVYAGVLRGFRSNGQDIEIMRTPDLYPLGSMERYFSRLKRFLMRQKVRETSRIVRSRVQLIPKATNRPVSGFVVNPIRHFFRETSTRFFGHP